LIQSLVGEDVLKALKSPVKDDIGAMAAVRRVLVQLGGTGSEGKPDSSGAPAQELVVENGKDCIFFYTQNCNVFPLKKNVCFVLQ